MSKSEQTGKVQTVLGVIDPSRLGVTLPHEHLICDARCNFKKPEETSDLIMAYRPLTPDIMWWFRYHNSQNLDDLFLLDEKQAIVEALYFKSAGGNAIVDVTNASIGRDPLALARISETTGLNVIMGSGYYWGASYGSEMNTRSEEDIAEEIVRDVQKGVGNTAIRSGIIGEIGCSWPLQNNELKVLRAAARAQKATGAPLNIHPAFGVRESIIKILSILERAGADLSRTVISHVDTTLRESKDRIKLVRTGCYLEYDSFGREVGFRFRPTANRLIETPNDVQRTNELIELIEKGFINQILISQDICNKNNLCAYGGWGYAHILRNLVPCMLFKGVTAEQIDTMMVANPRRLLTFT